MSEVSITCCDCVDGLRGLGDSSVDLVFTSPPYKDEDGYSHRLMYDVAVECFRVLRDNRVALVNFGHMADFKSRPFRVAACFEKAGFEWVDTITWVKNHFSPVSGSRRLNNLTEFVFLLAKGDDYELDRLSIGVPFVDKTNATRFAANEGRDLRCGGNVWYVPYETIQSKKQKTHRHRFPVQLPENGIRLSGIPEGSVVLDPFSGSGTTGVAAVRCGMSFIGFDHDLSCVESSKLRFSEGAHE